MSRLHDAFAGARAEGRVLLVGYFPAGFPSRGDDVRIIESMVANGVDAIEVGLPYSDPLMDGATIQEAVQRALEGGTHTDDVLATVRGVAATGVPTLVMSYWNPIERYGVERFAADLAAAGGVGVITPDLTPEESGPWTAASDAAGVERVFLVAPSSTDERIATVASASSGFVYAASTMGVTGARSSVGEAARSLVERTRARTSLPVAVGVGVSTRAQAAEVAGYADGVIVGSAFVKAVLDAPSVDDAVRAVGVLAAELARGVRHEPAPVG
jgi:tryptophan synthase alpha chain